MSFKLGNKGEAKVVEFFKTLGFKSEYNQGKTIEEKRLFDIETIIDKETKFTTEVKYDIYSVRSGNVAIELYNTKSGIPSGLNCTQAQLWAHITDKIYIARTSDLKDFIVQNKPFKTVTSGGDKNALLFLYKADFIFSEIFLSVEDLSKEDAKQAIYCYVKTLD